MANVKRYGLSSWQCAQEWGAPWDYGPPVKVGFVLAADYDAALARIARLEAALAAIAEMAMAGDCCGCSRDAGFDG